MKSKNPFVLFSQKISYATGHPAAFACALAIIILWGVTGPIFGFNDTWQLVINTGTTIITFLMVFLIQSTQNRDTAAIQLKLDELIRVTNGAHIVLMDLEELNDTDLEKFRNEYEKLAAAAREALMTGAPDTGTPTIDLAELYEIDRETTQKTP